MFEIFNNKMLGWSKRPVLPPRMPSTFLLKWGKMNYITLHDLLFPLLSNIFNVHLFIHFSIVWMYPDVYNHAHVNG